MPNGFAQIAGLPNYAELPSSMISTGATASLMGAELLGTPEPSDRTRLLNQGLQFVQIDKTVAGIPRLLGLINIDPLHNAQYRARASRSASLGPVVSAPLAIVTQNNFSSVVGVIQDDPFEPDANWMMVVNPAADCDVRLSFATSSLMLEGEDLQEFAVWVRKSGELSASNVVCTLELWESGVMLDNLEDVVVDSAGTLIRTGWDAIELADKTGADLELKIIGHSNGQDCLDIGAVVLHRDAVDPDVEFDSGWKDFPLTSVDKAIEEADLNVFWGGSDASIVGFEPQLNLVVDIGAVSILAAHFRIDFKYASSTTHLDAGVALLASAFSPEKVNFTGGFSADDQSVVKYTDTGKQYGSSLARAREYQIEFPSLTGPEMISLFDRLDWRSGSLRPFLLRLFPGDPILEPHTTVWVTASKLGKVDLWKAVDRHKKSYTFKEMR